VEMMYLVSLRGAVQSLRRWGSNTVKSTVISTYGIVYLLTAVSGDAGAASRCPTLSLPPQWKLENKELYIQGQHWYVSQFWRNVPKASGGDLPVNDPISDLSSAKKIEFLDQLDAEGRECRYHVTKQDNTEAQLVIKRIGSD